MNYTPTNGLRAVKQYGQVSVQSRVEAASPHHLILMLMEGALEKINLARGQMEAGNIAQKASNIGWAISIIDGLRASLDLEAGGDIARNLNDLYDYMENRLLEANIKNDTAALDEVKGLLREIREAWAAIGDVVKQSAQTAP